MKAKKDRVKVDDKCRYCGGLWSTCCCMHPDEDGNDRSCEACKDENGRCAEDFKHAQGADR